MKTLLIVVVLTLGSGFAYAQSGGVIPPPDIANAGAQIANAGNQAAAQAAQTRLIRQQTELLKQQTEALRQQNALLKEQQQAALGAVPAAHKPKIDDVNPATGQPRFASYAEYEDAKDEWLIEEALRRFESLHPTKKLAQ
jgi:hypothetical protein